MRNFKDQDFQTALNSAIEALNFLKECFGVKYTMQLSDETPNAIRVISDNMNDYNYERHMKGYEEEEHFRKEVRDIISKGGMVILCIDDTEKPMNFKGDWLKKNTMYIVRKQVKVKNGSYGFLLVGMESNLPYRISRFEKVINYIQEN